MKNWENKSLENLKGEVWKDIPGYEGEYQVSNLGRVKSLERKVNTWNAYKTIKEKILSQSKRGGRYLRVGRLGTVHRLVAKTFLKCDLDYGDLHVNHKNGNKMDNRVKNLEWCTPSENIEHAWDTGLMNEKTRKKMSQKAKKRTGKKNSCWRGYVNMYDLKGNFIKQFETLKDTQMWLRKNTKYNKADKGNISLVCNGKMKKMYGYKYKYSEEKINDG